MRNDGCTNSLITLEVHGHHGRGRPRKTWVNNDHEN